MLDPFLAEPLKLLAHRGDRHLIDGSHVEGYGSVGHLVQPVECVVHAETKDHLNWKLIGELAEHLTGNEAKALKEAHDEVEEQEDEHLYHTMGWSRELWIETLGMPAVIPPPEEEKEVKSMIGASRAEQSRDRML